ncbi:MAG: 5-formyltetrahydrofolate cyclo-ligase [Burkholderiales bacterium]|nr:5-formyltetrahydrofolate cyclo-ligase [Burkholderiales bacterium]
MNNLKQQMRHQALLRCSTLTREYKTNSEYEALHHLSFLLNTVSSVVVYHAHGVEFNLGAIIDYCQNTGKKLYQPVSYRHTKIMLLEKFCTDKKEIFSNELYIPQDTIQWYNVDLVLLPIVAVDSRGYRLGKGGGYYDTTLAHIAVARPCLCGVGYAIQQQLLDIPNESFDVGLDYFVSEQGITNFNRKR